MNGTAKKAAAGGVGAALLAALIPLIVEMATDGYHALRDEMIDDNMILIEDMEDRFEHFEALVDSLCLEEP